MKENPPVNTKALFFWLVLGVLIGWQGTVFYSHEADGKTPEESAEERDADLGLFWDVWDTVNKDYIDEEKIDEEQQVYGAISGLVDSLDDPYSVYMNPEETEAFQSSISGELEGIGAELTLENDLLTVVSPLKDSPAEEAGLLPGDYIFEVDGAPTSDMTLFEAIMHIRGEEGTEVVLTVLREGEDEALTLTITRQKITVPSVTLTFDESTGKTLAHLELAQFGDDTLNEFDAAVREILLHDVDGIILDLRLNGGGYLDASIEILGEFFEDKVKGVIVKHRNADNESLYTQGDGRLAEVPLVVLIDEGSASASEILAGALQDHERALLIGEQSFGKGSVQEWNALKDGSSLKLTIAKWYTPEDRTISDVGITPDVVVDMETAAIETENDTQYKAALDYLAQQ